MVSAAHGLQDSADARSPSADQPQRHIRFWPRGWYVHAGDYSRLPAESLRGSAARQRHAGIRMIAELLSPRESRSSSAQPGPPQRQPRSTAHERHGVKREFDARAAARRRTDVTLRRLRRCPPPFHRQQRVDASPQASRTREQSKRPSSIERATPARGQFARAGHPAGRRSPAERGGHPQSAEPITRATRRQGHSHSD